MIKPHFMFESCSRNKEANFNVYSDLLYVCFSSWSGKDYGTTCKRWTEKITLYLFLFAGHNGKLYATLIVKSYLPTMGYNKTFFLHESKLSCLLIIEHYRTEINPKTSAAEPVRYIQ